MVSMQSSASYVCSPLPINSPSPKNKKYKLVPRPDCLSTILPKHPPNVIKVCNMSPNPTCNLCHRITRNRCAALLIAPPADQWRSPPPESDTSWARNALMLICKLAQRSTLWRCHKSSVVPQDKITCSHPQLASVLNCLSSIKWIEMPLIGLRVDWQNETEFSGIFVTLHQVSRHCPLLSGVRTVATRWYETTNAYSVHWDSELISTAVTFVFLRWG